MSCDLSKLTEVNRKDFEARLAIYGLDADSVNQEELIVSRDSTIILSMEPDSFVKPRLLQTKDLDTVKRWIGVDDRVHEAADRESYICLPPPPLTSRVEEAKLTKKTSGSIKVSGQKTKAAASKEYNIDKLASSDFDNLQLAARTYVRNHSKLVPVAYKGLIEAHFGVFQIPIWALLKITVRSGSVLQFGPGANVLIASELEIEEGGIVRSYGHLTVNCTILRKPSLKINVAPSVRAQI